MGMAPRITLTTTPPPRTEAYLLHHRPRFGVFSRFNILAYPFRGRPLVALELNDQSVRCTILGRVESHPRWLAKRLGMPDLKERVKSGQVTVFELPRHGYEITWPKYDFGTLFQIGAPGDQPWTVAFNHGRDYTDDFGFDWWNIASAFADLQSLISEGRTHPARDQWRQALKPDNRQ
jgi:hypothetical protein